jgi:membrane fusion protein (multidrug efflux system)
VVYELPASALISDAEGLRVATVGADQRVHFVKLVVERDAGATIQISSGLRGDERIVAVGAAALSEGQRVNARELAADGAPQAKP